MSDEDDLDDIDADQYDLEKEEDEREMEEWEDYRKDGEEASEEVRAWRRRVLGLWAGGWGSRKWMSLSPSSCSGSPRPSRRP